MPLAIDGSTPAIASTPTAASVTTASFTPPTGSVVVLLIGAGTPGGSADTTFNTPTNTGTAITWTRRARKCTNSASTGGAGTEGGSEIWTGLGNGGAITVTATNALSGATCDKTLQAVVLTGANTTTLTNVGAASSASGLPSVTLTGCTAGSYVLAVVADWLAAGSATPGTGQTIITEYHAAGSTSIHNWRTTSTLASSGSQTMNLTAPTQQYNMCVLEVLTVGGTDATVVPPARVDVLIH